MLKDNQETAEERAKCKTLLLEAWNLATQIVMPPKPGGGKSNPASSHASFMEGLAAFMSYTLLRGSVKPPATFKLWQLEGEDKEIVSTFLKDDLGLEKKATEMDIAWL